MQLLNHVVSLSDASSNIHQLQSYWSKAQQQVITILQCLIGSFWWGLFANATKPQSYICPYSIITIRQWMFLEFSQENSEC